MIYTIKTIEHFWKKLRKTQRDGKIFHAHGRQNYHCENVNGTQAMNTFNANPIKIPWTFFRDLELIILRFVWNQDPWVMQRFGTCLWPRARSCKPRIESHVRLLVHRACFSLWLCLCLSLSLSVCDYHNKKRLVWNQKRPWIARRILKKTTISRASQCQISGCTTKMWFNTVWYWHKNRQMDQWNRRENPEVDPELYGQLIFDKVGKTIDWKKDSLFNKWCWEIGHPYAEWN